MWRGEAKLIYSIWSVSQTLCLLGAGISGWLGPLCFAKDALLAISCSNFFPLAAQVNNSFMTNREMKKAEYSAYWRISKTGNELVISLALPGVFLQRKVQAFEKEGGRGQEGKSKIDEWAERRRQWNTGEIMFLIRSVVMLFKLSTLHEGKLLNTWKKMTAHDKIYSSGDASHAQITFWSCHLF